MTELAQNDQRFQLLSLVSCARAGKGSAGMARLTDPEILARYKKPLSEWKVAGAIELEKDAPEGLRTTLEGVTVEFFKEALYRFTSREEPEIHVVHIKPA